MACHQDQDQAQGQDQGTDMNIAAAIEKNRKVLLRWVTCWLLAAIAYRCARTHLPPRISRFVNEGLRKCEAAIGHLLLAAQHVGAASLKSERRQSRAMRIF
ncbi:MAG: hypothetical protein U5K75_09895 [Ahrensia sp.]|nr:hypothetical protein [Ahrensia sp.]